MAKKRTFKKISECDMCPLLAVAQKMIQADESIKRNMLILARHKLFEIRNYNMN